ncbi:unnamed protein product [Cochlearia groenlandica]
MEWTRRETIGHGSFSTVSLATTSGNTTSFPPLIAVKSTGIVCSAALQNERETLKSLGECSDIVRCYGEAKTVENGEEIYNLFLEYASGGNLADKVKKSGESLPESKIRRYTRSIVKGLRRVHALGFSHCDLKLENVLVFDDGDVKISDFGLAKRRRRRRSEIGGEIRGTPLYMSPESVNRGEFEPPCDIWALGCCVVEMCSGKTAWCFDVEVGNVMSLMVRIGLSEEVPEIPVRLSREGRDFVKRCFVRNPKERWTAEMLLDHPFLTVDQIVDSVLVSPRDPFDFPGWNSVQSPVNNKPVIDLRFSYLVRLSALVTDDAPDWSVTCDWVNVR